MKCNICNQFNTNLKLSCGHEVHSMCLFKIKYILKHELCPNCFKKYTFEHSESFDFIMKFKQNVLNEINNKHNEQMVFLILQMFQCNFE
jgi:hypothetical protein